MIRFVALAMVALAVLASRAGAADNAFFAMDTGFRDGKHGTPEARAATLAELGYAGSDLTGTGNIPNTLKAYDAKGLKLFAIYVGANIDSDKVSPALARAIKQLKGRGTVLWMPLSSRKYKPGDGRGDPRAVKLLRKIADLAKDSGLKIALYPHAGSWVERVEDAARVAEKTGRDNVGATFNLCHWLQVDGKDLGASLRYAASKLFVVTINGADKNAKGWGRLIQTLDKGTFDVGEVLATLKRLKYTGPIGLQAYGIRGDAKENLRRSMAAWKKLAGGPAGSEAGKRTEFLPGENFSMFRGQTGDWKMVGEVTSDPKNASRLAWKAGKVSAVNGERGRTRHLVTKHEHGDCEAHIEFVVPKGSNSGVYFQGRYEIQVLDSWGVKKLAHGDCGGVYQRWAKGKGFEGHPPRVNASKKPGEWQTFDVIFRAPRFDAKGKKVANARFVKVVHNGMVVHENVEVTGPTRAAMFGDEKPTGPIMLQGDHGPVAYRNFWIVERQTDPGAK